MDTHQIFQNAFEPLIALFALTVVGIVSPILLKRNIEVEKQSKEKIIEIAEIISARADEDKAKALLTLVTKLPDSSNVNEFIRSFSKIADQVSVNQLYNFQQPVKQYAEAPQEWSIVESLVNGYHKQALDQAKIQFWFSVVAATMGFIWIIYTASSIDCEKLLTYFKIVPGVIIDVVALLFFKQAEATRQRATALYDRLRTDNQQAKAIQLVESIDDMKFRSAVKAQLSLHMAGVSPVDLTTFLSSGGQSTEAKNEECHQDPC